MSAHFKFVTPVSLQKSDNGDWRIFGKASTSNKDLQGEIIDLKGLDLQHIKNRKGTFNWEHNNDPENKLGIIDQYKLDGNGLYLGGYLFKNHSKAKAVYDIMSSLGEQDKGRMGLSVEGVIRERAGKDGKVIKKAVITGCALTMNPVNTETYCDLVKSLSAVEFFSTDIDDTLASNESEPMFTASQVISLLEKATKQPLIKEEKNNSYDMLDPSKSHLFKSFICDILEKISKLYPEVPKDQLWLSVKDRLYTKFPSIKD